MNQNLIIISNDSFLPENISEYYLIHLPKNKIYRSPLLNNSLSEFTIELIKKTIENLVLAKIILVLFEKNDKDQLSIYFTRKKYSPSRNTAWLELILINLLNEERLVEITAFISKLFHHLHFYENGGFLYNIAIKSNSGVLNIIEKNSYFLSKVYVYYNEKTPIENFIKTENQIAKEYNNNEQFKLMSVNIVDAINSVMYPDIN